MNEKIMEIFARNIVDSLPMSKRRIYQFIEGIEDRLAQQSETKEQFLTLLREQSPYHQAGNRFNLSLDETVKLMHEIEDEINEKLERKIRNYKWIDCTDQVYGHQVETIKNRQCFLIFQ
ncbi:hypothetical protein WQ57_18955 [Mesobacillus campisalis]|uniref:Uncharacterized protein n=1 Tax=Mesobacillus campisalis TaxID=1408103 RepID=A0A0M2SQJ9_9BACI|nr:hypothetical protein [Mesobacillus campisalis]KKK36498.1 hypothetical protein WQ57_18955 [Mesobacillus campisalis]